MLKTWIKQCWREKMKHNFPEHRYKHGKQNKAIDLAQFSEMLENAKTIELPERMRMDYDTLTIQSFLAVLYWTGLRKSEVIGAKKHRYILKPCEAHKEPLVRYTQSVDGILREDIEIKDDHLEITAPPRKHGKREAPLKVWVGFPYVDLIIKQWKRTPERRRVWAIREWDACYIMNQIDEKKYVHFFRFNRITKLCLNPEMSVGEICGWSGLSVQTIEAYLERSGRTISSTAEKMRRHYEQTSPTV